MRRHHLRWVGAVAVFALLLGVGGAAPAQAAPAPASPANPANNRAAAEAPETYSPIQIVTQVLGLSDAQAQTLAQILAARAESTRPLAEQIEQHEQQISTLLGGNHPDPTQLGRLLIETRQLQTQVQTIAAASASQFVSVLSDPQKQTLGQIRQASQVCPVVPAFAAIGVL
jgi:Spy/CpxP family protein refolding chaperone